MKVVKEILPLNDNLYRKLYNLCNFTNVELELINGIIFRIKNTNVSYIEPHRFIVKVNDIKLILLCYDNLNLYLYDKNIPINVPIVSELISNIKAINKGVC